MFDELTNKLQETWSRLKLTSQLTRDNIKEPMKDIRRALLEADVSLAVVRSFVKRVEDRAVGVEVIKGVKPGEQLVKVVYDELVALMGGAAAAPLDMAPSKPTVILMAGLQGVGKTTACGKLALYLQEKKALKVMLVATDVYRPAAIDQLVLLGEKVGAPVFSMGIDAAPVTIALKGLQAARVSGCDVVIVDTAGRLQVDADMMAELKAIKAAVRPTETLLVVDAMTGQQAAELVASFDAAAGITGAILTKMDGDARGGAALSVREVSGKPVKFTSTSEKMEPLEPFYPDRMASRILGMGDVLTLLEKAEASIKEEDAARLQRRMRDNEFDFGDYLKQTELMASMGSMASIMKMMPGMAGKLNDKQFGLAEKKLRMDKSMIQSMTLKERAEPALLAANPSRRKRIARGSGRTEADVSNLVAQFATMRKAMTSMSRLMDKGQRGEITEAEMIEAMKPSPGGAAREKVKVKKAPAPAKMLGFGAATSKGKK